MQLAAVVSLKEQFGVGFQVADESVLEELQTVAELAFS